MGPVGTGVWKNSGRLADGREIIYFDEAPGLDRAAVPDSRDLPPEYLRDAPPPRDDAAGLRWDALRGEWVVIAAQRQDRTFLPPVDECPLDPSRPGRPTEIPAPGYDVVVFENRFPSLRGAGHWPPRRRTLRPPPRPVTARNAPRTPPRPETGGVPGGPATGGVRSSASRPITRRRSPASPRAGSAPWWRRGRTGPRCSAPCAGIEQVYCFENRGEEIGVTLHHPHGQIYGFPFVTPRTQTMLTQARAVRGAHRRGTCSTTWSPGELAAGSRVVTRNEHWTAFVPRRGPVAVRGAVVPGPAGAGHPGAQ